MSIITHYCCRHRHQQLFQLIVLYFVITNTNVIGVVSITSAFNFNDNQNNNNNNNNNNNMKFAWKSSGKNQYDLIQKLRNSGIIRTDKVQQIMEQVDRKNYCGYYRHDDDDGDVDVDGDEVDKDNSKDKDDEELLVCYLDRALSIGTNTGQTISAPHMHAYALEEIFPSLIEKYNTINNRSTTSNSKNENEILKILDVGCGSGYLTTCFGRFIESLSTTTTTTTTDTATTTIGKVFGIDIRQDLVDMTKQNINRQDSDLLLPLPLQQEGSTSTSTSTSTSSIINLSWGNGWKGLPKEAPFDCIHVGAAAESLPYELINQLKLNGIMIIPIGSQESSKPQILYKIKRIADTSCSDINSHEEMYHEDDFEITTLLGVRYVPLIHDDNDDEDK